MQVPAVLAHLDADLPTVFLGQNAVAHAVFDQGLDDQRRNGPILASVLHIEPDPDALAEAGLLDGQIAADLVQLLGEGDEAPAGFQAFAQVAGEVLQQSAGLFGACAAKGGDGVQ